MKPLLSLALLGALALTGCDAAGPGDAADSASSAHIGSATSTESFAGTVSEIVDPAAETGIPRRWMRHVGDPAPAGYGHGYQWGTPSITTPAGAGAVTFTGTLDVVDAVAGDFGLIGLLDTATLAADERGLNEGSYIYLSMRNATTLVLGLSDGRGDGGEYVQTFHTIDLTTTDRVFDVTFTIDASADPAGCATDPADVPTAEGCLTLAVDDRPVLTDSYGTITNDGANGGIEFRDGGTAGWDGLASAQAATGFDYDFTVSPTVARAPQTKDDCKNGGWQQYDNPSFRNQGQCIRFVNTGR
ncbi:hypothetical protein [Rubrivirga sp. IMCC43871]|uniref:hypothetical protein n=1 Tax=Rubrivirga sp. IMCC43871 TaxID=3391575 RepID=UPI00398FA516